MFRLSAKFTYRYQKATIVAIAFLLVFPVMPILPNSYIIGAVTGFLLLGIFIKPVQAKPYYFQKPLLLSGIYIVLILSLLYTQDFNEGLYALEKRAALVIFPLIFFLKRDKITYLTVHIYENIFIVIIFIFFSWVNLKIALDINDYIQEGSVINSWYGALQNDLFSFFYRTRFEKISNIHPTYAGIFVLFSAGILSVRILNGTYNSRKTYSAAIFILVLLVYGSFIAAKGPLLAFVVAVIVVSFIRLKRSKFYWITGGILILFVASVFLFPPLKKRANEFLLPTKEDAVNSVSIRKIIYKTSWNLVKEVGVLGVGVGDVQDQLNKKYQKYDIKEIREDSLNTHNEYMNMWLSAGLLGLFIMIFTFGLPLFEAIKKKNTNFIFFLAFMIIVFSFENILSRQKGVLFFALFYLIYYYYLIDKETCRQDIQNT